jgi:hypothetical protein
MSYCLSSPQKSTIQKEDLMRKITMTLAAAIFVVGSMAVANAQTQGASSLNAQAQNATIVHKAACNGVRMGHLRLPARARPDVKYWRLTLFEKARVREPTTQ